VLRCKHSSIESHFLSTVSIQYRFSIRQLAVLDKFINVHDVFDSRYI